MTDNTVTLVLNGDIPLDEFAKAIVNFTELIKALSAESGLPTLDWLIQDLSVSSATATAMANLSSGSPTQIQAVIDGYADVGTALENRTDIRHSEAVRTAARKIVSIEDRRINAVHFDTAKRGAIVRLRKPEASQAERVSEWPLSPSLLVRSTAASYGAVQGRIQTLTNRGSLRFTLYDLHYDKAVSCYFAEGKEESIFGLWGKLAIVEGLITRDPLTGRPLSIRQVQNITPLQEAGSEFEYQAARGIAPSVTGISAEEAVRRVRDAQ